MPHEIMEICSQSATKIGGNFLGLRMFWIWIGKIIILTQLLLRSLSIQILKSFNSNCRTKVIETRNMTTVTQGEMAGVNEKGGEISWKRKIGFSRRRFIFV